MKDFNNKNRLIMKKKICIGLATLVAFIGISLLTFKPESAQAVVPCPEAYQTFTGWPGPSQHCSCIDMNYAGFQQCSPEWQE